jgi:hypothetical protein
VVDPNNPKKPVQGLIPTGWFPSAVAVSAKGDQIYEPTMWMAIAP